MDGLKSVGQCWLVGASNPNHTDAVTHGKLWQWGWGGPVSKGSERESCSEEQGYVMKDM